MASSTSTPKPTPKERAPTHSRLRRQLRELGLDVASPPTVEGWRRFLERVEKAYGEPERPALAEETRNQLLANVSHEIRTPLNGLIGIVGLLAETRLDSEQQDYVDTLRASGETLLAIVDDLLDLSRLEAGRLELELQPFELRRLVTECVELYAARAAAGGLHLSHAIDDSCPHLVRGDATRLRQVLVHLLSNAVKFTRRGEVAVAVVGRAAADGRCELRFAVKDTGVGLAAADVERIFDAFEQADGSSDRRYGGAGLGLAISRRLCAMMGGRIWVESEPGRGSTFHFTLRVERLREAALAGVGSRRPPAIRNDLGRSLPLRILVADDAAINQKIARLLLGRLGYRADLAGNGLEVLEALERRRYDVVLMDVQMPELDGLETARRIGRRWGRERRPKIVAVTASTRRDDRERCLAAGMDAYLPKPVRVEDLQEVLLRLGGSGEPTTPRTATTADGKAGGPPEVDLEILADLRRLRPRQTHELVESFLTSAERRLASLRQAVADADDEALRQTAHSLKGSSGTLGAHHLAELAAGLVERGRGRALEKASAPAELEAELETLERELGRVRRAFTRAFADVG